jgi:uncharacterized repeat protein (TIGR01451 family)
MRVAAFRWLCVAAGLLMAGLLLPFAHAASITNTARVLYVDPAGSNQQRDSNAVTLSSLPPPSPAVVSFHRYAPGLPDAQPTPSDGAQCANSAGVFLPPLPVTTTTGAPIDLSSPAPIESTGLYHAGEPVFVTLTDANRNTDAALRESVEVTLSSSTGDQERLLLWETGLDTGIFAGAIRSGNGPVVSYNCKISLAVQGTLTVNYVDLFYPSDTASANTLVDPFGFVFNSTTGAWVNGATITLINAATGQPAAVFGDDGISSYPATVTSGGQATDASGAIYTFPAGGFRFPFVAPGDYRLVAAAPAGFTAPSTVALAQLQTLRDPNGNPFTVVAGSFADQFTVPLGPALHIDIPVDPSANSLMLEKSASRAEVSVGDFIQYRLSLRNLNATPANAVTIADVLPFGFRYRAGSTHVDGQRIADPSIGSDGRTLTFTLGTLGASATVQIAYVLEVAAGAAAGDALNTARASSAGVVASNQAQATVRVRAPFFGNCAVLVGRVVEGEATTPWEQLKGVPKARVVLDNGVYTTTDDDGQFHFEGVCNGTHVVQLDLDSLPPELEAIPAIQNSRFAGRAYSQFVDVQGGSLWRTDFYVRRKLPINAPVGIKLQSQLKQSQELGVQLELDGAAVPVKNLRVTLMMPAGVRIEPNGVKAEALEAADNIYTVRLGDVGADWTRRLELAGRAPAAPARNFTVRARFDTARAELTPEARKSLNDLVAQLRHLDITHIEAIGHTDSQPILGNRTGFRDNHELSSARAQTVGLYIARMLGLTREQITATGRGPDEPVADNAGAEGRAQNRRVELVVHVRAAKPACPAEGFIVKAMATFDTELKKNVSTPMVESRLACGNDNVAASERRVVEATGKQPTARVIPAPAAKAEALDDVTAAGAKINWLAQAQTRPLGWLFPEAEHNPRAPALRVAISHLPGQRVVLKRAGKEVDALNFDGSEASADQRVAVSVWRGIPLGEGDNVFSAEVLDAAGNVVTQLQRTVHYANSPARAELLPAQSVLLADGLTRPRLALRLTDAAGRPVRAGVTGPFTLNPPYVSQQLVDLQQSRQLAGADRFQPMYRVEGDEGIAYVELQPTTESGAVVLNLAFEHDGRQRVQELRTWLEPVARDWIVVGFAEGTVGYNTLKGNMQGLAGQDDELYTDGQTSFYAKGRVKGEWLLTLAYDSDKPRERERLQGMNQVIKPDEFYTLYGDGTAPRHDAPSQAKLYLKLERSQFYALFGDYDTGLTQTQLTRYSRSLNGIKSEYAGAAVQYTAFAADTPQRFVRDELQGNGTSGLYRLTRGGIVLNSEKIRIETRDRFRSEVIVTTRTLARHLDYDIDYSAGTLFFREPVNARDANFNPNFIVAEYEVLDAGEKALNAGGRVAVPLMEGKATVGVSHLRDEQNLSRNDVNGIDVKVRLAPETELRLEAAQSDGEQAGIARQGDAYLAEVEHRGQGYDALAYVRRQEPSFGVGQQSGAESGMEKRGAKGRIPLTETVRVEAEVNQLENLTSAATRDQAAARVAYQSESAGASVGLQHVRDEAATGERAESEQVTLGANRKFFDGKVELLGQTEYGIGGKNESVDYPDRILVQAGYQVTPEAKLIAAQEYTNGGAFDTQTTRVGAVVNPWQGAKLSSTLNQGVSEYGPRTYGLFGLTQAFVLDKHWGVDFGLDRSRTFNESGSAPIVPNPNQPISSGGSLGSGALTEDYTAVSAGATYREELWSWNGRIESRQAESEDRFGIVSNFLRQAAAGVAFASSLQAFTSERASGAEGVSAKLDLSWAYRPLGQRWAMLDRLSFRYETLDGGTGVAGSGLFGATSLNTAGSARSRALVNYFNVNRVSRQWSESDTQGNLFTLNQRDQWSVFYGSKYVFDNYDGVDYSGYTDLLGFELRHDLTRRWDIGVQASMLHSWEPNTYQYSWGPSVGFSPMNNAWISVGYNVLGFADRDFADARYTAQGFYLKLRFKFDQNSRFSKDDGKHPQTVTPDDYRPASGAAP